MPEIICLYQTYGMPVLDIVYYMTRTYVYGLHRKKLILTGKWPYSTKDLNYCNLNEQTYSQNVSGAVTTAQDVFRVLPYSNMPSDQLAVHQLLWHSAIIDQTPLRSKACI